MLINIVIAVVIDEFQTGSRSVAQFGKTSSSEHLSGAVDSY